MCTEENFELRLPDDLVLLASIWRNTPKQRRRYKRETEKVGRHD